MTELSLAAQRLLASDSTDLGAELHRNRAAVTAKPQAPEGVFATVNDVRSFRDSTVEETRHALAMDAHNQNIAAQAADLIQNAELITDPGVLTAAYERINAISPEAATLLLENAVSLPDHAALLAEQHRWNAASANLAAEQAAAERRETEDGLRELESVQRASEVAQVDWLRTLEEVDKAAEIGLALSPAQGAEVARSLKVADDRREQRAERFDKWFTPALTSRGQREDLAREKDAYVDGDAPVEYRFEHASPEAVNAARLARQDEMKQALLGRVPTDLPSHEAWKTAGEAVAPRPKSAVDERDRQADAPSIY